MTLIAFVLILFSVLLHAGWNLISKTYRPNFPFFSLFSLSACLTLLPLTLYSEIPVFSLPAKVWVTAVSAGLCCGALFYVGMSFAYRNMNLSVAYPLIRALPIFFTVIITTLFHLGKTLNLTSVIGIGILFFGCVWMGIVVSKKEDNVSCSYKKGMIGILVATAGTTGYTILDSIGLPMMFEATPNINHFFSTVCYYSMREVCACIFLFVFSLLDKNKRPYFNKGLFLSWRPYVSGCFACLAYLLVLLAMSHVSNASFVLAFNQMSLPIGVFFSVVFLREKISPGHLLGVILILIGLVISVF